VKFKIILLENQEKKKEKRCKIQDKRRGAVINYWDRVWEKYDKGQCGEVSEKQRDGRRFSPFEFRIFITSYGFLRVLIG
jgi:hypothetical protein